MMPAPMAPALTPKFARPSPELFPKFVPMNGLIQPSARAGVGAQTSAIVAQKRTTLMTPRMRQMLLEVGGTIPPPHASASHVPWKQPQAGIELDINSLIQQSPSEQRLLSARRIEPERRQRSRRQEQPGRHRRIRHAEVGSQRHPAEEHEHEEGHAERQQSESKEHADH